MSMEKIVVLKIDPFMCGKLSYNGENNCRGVQEDELINNQAGIIGYSYGRKIK